MMVAPALAWRVATIRTAALVDYRLGLSSGPEHVAALSDALAAFGRTVRVGIEEMNELDAIGSRSGRAAR